MKPTHTKHSIYVDSKTREAVKELQSRQPLATLGAVIAQAVQDAVNPVSGADHAREFLRQAGGDFKLAGELLQQYLHRKYRDFHSKRQPGKREYDCIRRTLHNLLREN